MSDLQVSERRVIDVKTFWQAAGLRATGAAVVTARASDGARGFFALSATHLCADPPMMMISVDEKTSALQDIIEAGHFAINYLASGQQEMMAVFGGKSDLKGEDRFGTGKWKTLATGAPVLVNASGVVDCKVDEVVRRHGTAIVIGRVVDFEASEGAAPMVLYKGKSL